MASRIFEVLKLLEAKRIHYFLERTRKDSIRVCATFVGQRVEIDVFEDQHIEISRFHGDESIEGGLEFLIELLKSE
jgi:hypothetical protein